MLCRADLPPQQLRQRFRKFADTDRYPDLSVGFWLGTAQFFINTRRWSTAPITLPDGDQVSLADYGTMLVSPTTWPSRPGTSRRPQPAECPPRSSVTAATSWLTGTPPTDSNASRYGVTYLCIARMVGAGAVQVGTGGGPTGIPYNEGMFWQLF